MAGLEGGEDAEQMEGRPEQLLELRLVRLLTRPSTSSTCGWPIGS